MRRLTDEERERRKIERREYYKQWTKEKMQDPEWAKRRKAVIVECNRKLRQKRRMEANPDL